MTITEGLYIVHGLCRRGYAVVNEQVSLVLNSLSDNYVHVSATGVLTLVELYGLVYCGSWVRLILGIQFFASLLLINGFTIFGMELV